MSTKKLAKELGLLRQRSHASSGTKKSPLSNQVFSHLIVIDFESTCWREKNNYGQEIIEFPAVLLNTSTGEVESEFHTYVQPQEHPILSEFCTELTGITQVQVEAGIPLRICLSRFSRWLQNLQHQMGVVFPSMQQRSSEALPSQKLCTFLTWSDWDLGVCLQYECKRKQIHKPDVLNSWIDLRSTYRLFYNRKPKGLNGALQDLGIQFEGREHSGLDDARNTAQLAARMMRDGCIMKITRSLERTPLTSKPIFDNKTCPPENKKDKPKLNTDKTANKLAAEKTSTSKISPKSCQTVSSTENHSRILNSKEGVVQESVHSLVSPKTVLSGTGISSWGHSRRSNTANIVTNLCSSDVINSTSSCSNNSLVLCSTTVGGPLHVPRPNQPLKTGAEVKRVEESVEITVESEDRCGSYDDVVLDGDDVCSVTDFEYVSDVDSGCYGDSHSSVGQVTLMGQIKETAVGNKSNSNEMRQNSTVSEPRVCFTVPKSVTSKSNHPTKGVTKTSSELPHKSETNTHPMFKTKPFVPGKTSTPGASFSRPKTVITQDKRRRETSKFTIYTDPGNMAAGTSSCPTPKNTLSSLSANTLSSWSTNRSFVPRTLKGGLKITAPFCSCGRRAKRQVVSNGGPNQGRWFYCCPVRRSVGTCGRIQKGCEFFKWESAVMKSSSTSSGSSVSLCHFNSTVNCQPHQSSLRKSY